MLNRLKKIYVSNPQFWAVYTGSSEDYIIIDDIPNSRDFFAHAVVLNKEGRCHIKNWKANIEMLNVIVK